MKITVVWYEKYLEYLVDFATNNINFWFFKYDTLSDLRKVDLIVLEIA